MSNGTTNRASAIRISGSPVRTARLTVTTLDGNERDVRITPWNGAYVVAAPGTHSTLTGYDADGNMLGTLPSEGTPPPEPKIDESRRVSLPVGPANSYVNEPILTCEPGDDETRETRPDLAD